MHNIEFYKELLKQKEWQIKCNEILSRDYYVCQDCGKLGFHNGHSYATFHDIIEVEKIMNMWRIDGCTISDFCSRLDSYNLEHFREIKLKDLDAFNISDRYLLNFSLYCKGSKYFGYRPRGLAYGNFISDIRCDKLDIGGIKLDNVVKHKFLEITHNWLWAFKFDRELAKNVHFFVNGNNNYIPGTDKFDFGNYNISINYGRYLLVLSINSNIELFKGLNIHHMYYIKGNKPWEYEDSALITLCEECHKKRHMSAPVAIRDSNMIITKFLSTCDRCGGSGYLPQYEHFQHGICFRCGGEGVVGIE